MPNYSNWRISNEIEHICTQNVFNKIFCKQQLCINNVIFSACSISLSSEGLYLFYTNLLNWCMGGHNFCCHMPLFFLIRASNHQKRHLIPSTLWKPVYNIFVPIFQPKNSSFWLPYQRHNSSADCGRELLNDSNGSASLLVRTRKKIFWFGGADFVSDVISEVVLG